MYKYDSTELMLAIVEHHNQSLCIVSILIVTINDSINAVSIAI